MHFEQIGMKLGIPGERDKKMRKPGTERLAPNNITHYDMIKWIEGAGIDEETKRDLLKEIARYPANTMNHFFKNIHKHIERIHKNRKKKEEA